MRPSDRRALPSLSFYNSITSTTSHRAVRHSRPRRPADWYLPAFHSLIILTEILRFVETLQRVSKSAEVGPRRTMVSFIGMLTLVHPFATTWHFPSRGNEKFRGAFRLSADRPRMTLEGGALRSRSSIPHRRRSKPLATSHQPPAAAPSGAPYSSFLRTALIPSSILLRRNSLATAPTLK